VHRPINLAAGLIECGGLSAWEEFALHIDDAKAVVRLDFVHGLPEPKERGDDGAGAGAEIRSNFSQRRTPTSASISLRTPSVYRLLTICKVVARH
jgi:hypothetical protein